MKKAILGKKIGMTQVFLDDGRVAPVTVVLAGPCTVVQKKTVETDGYEAVQVGFGELTETRAKKLKNKPELGHFKKAGVEPTRVLREFRLDDISSIEVGQKLTVECVRRGRPRGRVRRKQGPRLLGRRAALEPAYWSYEARFQVPSRRRLHER